MAVFLFSLMGIPPLVGFMGKLYVFAAVIEKGPGYWWYAVVGAVNAAIAAYYYARILKTMIIDAGNEDRPAFRLGTLDAAWVAAFLAANVLPLLWWGRIEGWARQSLGLVAGN
jgi:NADH-quinone oxidoreductase subunit N